MSLPADEDGEREEESEGSTARASAEAPASRKSRAASEAAAPPGQSLAEPTTPSPVEKSSLGTWSLRPREGKGSNARPVTPPFSSGENGDGEDEFEKGGPSPPSEATAPFPKARRSHRAIPLLPPVAARFGRAGWTQSRDASEEASG